MCSVGFRLPFLFPSYSAEIFIYITVYHYADTSQCAGCTQGESPQTIGSSCMPFSWHFCIVSNFCKL